MRSEGISCTAGDGGRGGGRRDGWRWSGRQIQADPRQDRARVDEQRSLSCEIAQDTGQLS